MGWKSERGVAMIVALFMVLAMSVIGSSLMFVSQTETVSSHNYRLMSQARYGAESAVHRAANFVVTAASYTPPGTANAADAMTAYVRTGSAVQYDNQDVVLSAGLGTAQYPVANVKTAFAAAGQGSLDVGDGSVIYTSSAKLKSMREITDAYSLVPVTLQTWEVTGVGTIGGARPAKVEVSAVVERQTTLLYPYAAFATDNGCAALSFAGGATTDSYDSTNPLGANGRPTTSPSSGNVGTNGNLTEAGNPTTINGTLSTPRAGVGACTTNNVTAQTISGQATVTGGLNQLSQNITYPTPEIPAAPTTSQDFKKNDGCPTELGPTVCAASTDGATITPGASAIVLGNVNVSAGAVLQLNAGTYSVNSFTMNGNARIIIKSGPVIFKVSGKDSDGDDLATPITITGNGISNTTGNYNAQNLQFQYAGTGEVKLAGGDETAAVVYAPNATASISGGADLYGAIVVNKLTATGGSAIHYDRRLQTSGEMAGKFMMSAFTWKNY